MKDLTKKRIQQIFLAVENCQCGKCIVCHLKKQMQKMEGVDRWLNEPDHGDREVNFYNV